MSNRRFWLHAGAATVAIMLGCWLSSGTMTPYGTMLYDSDCHYRVNQDHYQFTAVYAMLQGRAPVVWGYSVVLRRVLHPLLAFPLMQLFGFDLGGLLFNVLLHGASMIAVARAFRRYFDARAAVTVCWLYATWPGYAYWAGLPYSYALIVPGSLACTIALLWWFDAPSLRRTIVAACVVGVVGVGYDLMPFFGGALLLLVAYRRRWRDLAVALVALGAWAAFIARGLPAIFGFDAHNSNTQEYGNVIDAWLHPGDHVDGWGGLVADAPHVLISNFFYSAMLFFPCLLLVAIALRLHAKVRLGRGAVAVAVAVGIATFGVWAVLNLGPPYVSNWQLRGVWISRLYQPWFVAVLLVVAAASLALREAGRMRHYRVLVGACALTVVLGALTIAGPYVGVRRAYVDVYEGFYRMEQHQKNKRWWHSLGMRPYGVCE